MREPFEILGMDRGSSKEELTARYEELKARYSEARFLPGEEGNEAARKLTELEIAWQIICEGQDKQQYAQNTGSDFGLVDNLIKEGRYDEAQACLDNFNVRDAEWHYFQSMVYYRREWMGECHKHLKKARELDPLNEKYKTALERVELRLGNPNVDPRTLGGNNQTNGVPNDQQLCGNNFLSNCCMAYCCTECCCTLTRCCL